jgi:transmembrane sensor
MSASPPPRDPSSPPSGAPAGRPLDWPVRAGAVDDVLAELQSQLGRQRRRRHRAWAGAAVAAVALLAGWRFVDHAASPAAVAAAPAALVSLPVRQTLPDGTAVELRGEARIRVAFEPTRRGVVLERGEAHFSVTHDPARPFVVSAGGVEFRAVGTSFAVQLGARAVDLIVTEGRVAVERSGETGSASGQPSLAVVEKGTRLVVALGEEAGRAAPEVDVLSEAELGRRLAWRAPKLEFSGTPLATAIELINRAEVPAGATRPRLILGDPTLASVRLSGVLRADNVETLLGVLEASHGIKAERRGATEVVLHRAR